MLKETRERWTTCARRRSANKMMRENTDSEAFFEKYTLSEETMTRLESIREMMKDSMAQANPLWKVIAGQVRIAPADSYIMNIYELQSLNKVA